MGFFSPAFSPYEIMSLDTIGGFSIEHSTPQRLYLLVNNFFRFAFTSTSIGQSAQDLIKLVESVLSHHPITTLLTDQYGALSSDECKKYRVVSVIFL